MLENSSTNLTLDELIAYSSNAIIVYQIVLPAIGIFGAFLCVLSIWIFSKNNFLKPVYLYYRVILFWYISSLILSVPYGFCISPTYFPNMNSYDCAIVQSVYISYTTFVFHYTGTIEIAILLDRIKIFNPTVKKYFNLKPKMACLLFLVPCTLVGSVFSLVYWPKYGGDYFYVDSNGSYLINSFYYIDLSFLAQSHVGRVVFVIILVIRDYFTMITSVTLNIVTVVQMKAYFQQKRKFFEQQSQIGSIESSASSKNKLKKPKDSNRIIEKNHLFMVIVLCLITFVSRTITMTCDIYYLFSTDDAALILAELTELSIVICPSLSIFVFYNFNKDFKVELSKIIKSVTKYRCSHSE